MTSSVFKTAFPVLGLLAGPIGAQETPVEIPAEPLAVLAQGFTRIAGLHELSDGRLVLLDADDRLVYTVTPDLGTATQVGRHGSGPGEYIWPVQLFALAADSTAILDRSNGRMLIITPAGTAGGIIDLRYSGPGSTTAPRVRLTPSASDASNHLYMQASPVRTDPSGTLRAVDSAAILRWIVGSAPDTIGFVPIDASRQQVASGLSMSAPVPPFTPVARWAVAQDGRVGVVTPQPFQVVMYSPDGPRSEGPEIAYQPVRVTDRHRELYREEVERPRPVLAGGRPGAGQASGIRMSSFPFTEPAEWPEYLPPFTLQASIQFSPEGTLWIERTTATPDDRPLYDVIDEGGRRMCSVLLPQGTRFAGFGRETLYVVRRDEVDLEYLERYQRPSRCVTAS